MRGAFFAIQESYIEEYVEIIFKSYWSEGKDISSIEVLHEIISNFKWDKESFSSYIEDQSVKDKLSKNTKELIDRGGFGSPTFFINEDEMFFGNDRLRLIEEVYLKA